MNELNLSTNFKYQYGHSYYTFDMTVPGISWLAASMAATSIGWHFFL